MSDESDTMYLSYCTGIWGFHIKQITFIFVFIAPYLIARYMSNVTARATIDREQPTWLMMSSARFSGVSMGLCTFIFLFQVRSFKVFTRLNDNISMYPYPYPYRWKQSHYVYRFTYVKQLICFRTYCLKRQLKQKWSSLSSSLKNTLFCRHLIDGLYPRLDWDLNQ